MRLTVRIDEELKESLAEKCRDVPVSTWVRGVLERELGIEGREQALLRRLTGMLTQVVVVGVSVVGTGICILVNTPSMLTLGSPTIEVPFPAL